MERSVTKRATPYNLASRNQLCSPCDLAALEAWFDLEAAPVSSPAVADVLRSVARNMSEFVKWPSDAILLWRGCDRTKPDGARQRYHRYPQPLKDAASSKGIVLDTRPNGPAIAAFLVAGGERPRRFGSTNDWSVHHLYSGKFPYIGKTETLHAAKSGFHFTQSAGLVAAHPVADALADEFPFFTWLLRAEAFRRFGYDPDGAFTADRDALGFAGGKSCRVLFEGP